MSRRIEGNGAAGAAGRFGRQEQHHRAARPNSVQRADTRAEPGDRAAQMLGQFEDIPRLGEVMALQRIRVVAGGFSTSTCSPAALPE